MFELSHDVTIEFMRQALGFLIAVSLHFVIANAEDVEDYGPPPKKFESRAKAYVGTRLKDAPAARWKIDKALHKAFLRDENNTYSFGWAVCMQINSKNSFGAYTGFQPMFVLFKDDEIVGLQDLDYRVQDACGT